MMMTYLIKLFDEVMGRIITSVLLKPIVPNSNKYPNTLFLIRPGGIGDAVLLAPAIRSLKKNYPGIHITVLAEQRNAGVFQLIPGVDRLFCYDRNLELLQALRISYDVVIDSEQSHQLSAVVARFVSAPLKIGFNTNERRRMFTHTIPYSHDDYETARFSNLLEPLGVEVESVNLELPFLSLPHSAISDVAGLLEELNGKPFVTLFPGASIAERRWGTERFRLVVDALSAFGIQVVIVGGKEDRQQGGGIADGGLGLNLAGLTTLAETAAVIQKSSLLLSGDSGLLHIAVGLGVPTVSLFGPGRAKKWAPKGERHIVINRELPCSPCTTFGATPPCPIDARCMRDITTDEVVNAVTMLLTSVGTMPSSCCKRDWIEVKKG